MGQDHDPIGGLATRYLSWPATVALFVPVKGLTAWYIVRHAGRSKNDLVKIAFVLGMMLVFIPMDVVLELSGDTGILVYTALIIGLLIQLRQRVKQADKPLSVKHSVV